MYNEKNKSDKNTPSFDFNSPQMKIEIAEIIRKQHKIAGRGGSNMLGPRFISVEENHKNLYKNR